VRSAHLRWTHALRGEIRPLEFLRVAESIGLGLTLSRAALRWLVEDFRTLHGEWEPGVRISFSPLRDHILQGEFADEIERVVSHEGIAAERLELRIAEKDLITRDTRDLFRLRDLGVQLIVDEAGRSFGSLSILARAPVCGLQFDRSWVTTAMTDEVARRVCQAGARVAEALGLFPIASGVDDDNLRSTLLGMGYRYGSGDFFNRNDQSAQLAVPGVLPERRRRRASDAPREAVIKAFRPVKPRP
jgi:EAL domain-containing protein (putative c-di-GMP-specific phosphodiesterase class I)